MTDWKGKIAWPVESKEEAVGTGPESILGRDFFVSSVLWKPAAILFLSTIPADLLKGRICISMGNLHFHSRQRLNFLSLVVLRQVHSWWWGWGVSVCKFGLSQRQDHKCPDSGSLEAVTCADGDRDNCLRCT